MECENNNKYIWRGVDRSIVTSNIFDTSDYNELEQQVQRKQNK